MDCLYAECTPCITDCVLAELEKLGTKYRVALKIAKVGWGPCLSLVPASSVMHARSPALGAVLGGAGASMEEQGGRRPGRQGGVPREGSPGPNKTRPRTPAPASCPRLPCAPQDERVERLPCTHKGTYADDCICERVKQHRCYIVATCDKDLKRRLRKASVFWALLQCVLYTLCSVPAGRRGAVCSLREACGGWTFVAAPWWQASLSLC